MRSQYSVNAKWCCYLRSKLTLKWLELILQEAYQTYPSLGKSQLYEILTFKEGNIRLNDIIFPRKCLKGQDKLLAHSIVTNAQDLNNGVCKHRETR